MKNKYLNESWNFDNTYVDLPNSLFSSCKPISVKNPQLVCFNNSLAKSLDLDFLIGERIKKSKWPMGKSLCLM